ncbi:MAG TPA: PqqD family protein [Chloroflexia bacterium]|nr:PqqD family protein [Chloroflexia bacterium]
MGSNANPDLLLCLWSLMTILERPPIVDNTDSAIADDQYYLRNPRTAWQLMDEGGMILNLPAQELTATNTTGGLIWEELAAPRTARQLSDALAREFEVTPDAALATVRPFLATLLARGLISPVPSAARP